MPLKTITLPLILCTTLTYAHDIPIRPAEQKDIPGMLTLSSTVLEEYFKPTIRAGCPQLAHDETLCNEFFNEADNAYHAILTQVASEQNHDNYHILIASKSKNPDNILGLCLFKQETDSIHIAYLIVAQESRGKGIGKALLDHTISAYPEVYKYTLATLAAQSNAQTQAFYERYGFTTNKELITLDERIPHAHIIYELNLKK
jgi:predicted GNAT family N-acyltransferase